MFRGTVRRKSRRTRTICIGYESQSFHTRQEKVCIIFPQTHAQW